MKKLPKYFQIGTILPNRSQGSLYKIRKKDISKRKSILNDFLGYDMDLGHSRLKFLEV